MIKAQGFIALNYGGADKLVMVHPSDIAHVAAEELVTPSEGQKVRYVASDERNEIAHVLGAAIGKPELKWTTLSNDQMQADLKKQGFPPAICTILVDLYASIHSGAMGEDYELHKPLMGSVKLEAFSTEFAEAFQNNKPWGH